MPDRANGPSRIAIIGGGITGLAAAHRLVELDSTLEVILLEASNRLGGRLETVVLDGFMVEHGADNFITNDSRVIDFCRRIGFEDQLVSTNDKYRRAFVVHRGRLREIPNGFVIMAPGRFGPLLSTPILSWRGKLRLAWEYFVPARTDEADESLASFVIRRLGRETYQRLVQPLVGGIYTADPEKLSLQATMPRFQQMEREHGSLIRAAWRQARLRRKVRNEAGARYSLFVAPRRGMSSLVDAIAERLSNCTIKRNSPVQSIMRTPRQRWQLSLEGDESSTCEVDAVILATPADRAASLLADIDADLASRLNKIPHATCAVVSLGYRREQIAHPLDGFGFVTPLVERRKILSGSFSSVKYPGRAPKGRELIRVFIGGACQPELALLPHEDLRSIAVTELGQLLGITGDPLFYDICRWPSAMPQYHLGHEKLVADVETRTRCLPGLRVAGNAYHGVGIPQCIQSGEQAAEQILAGLRSPASSSKSAQR